MKIRIRPAPISFFCLICATLLVPLNYILVAGLRPSDLFLLLAISIYMVNGNVSRQLFLIASIFLILVGTTIPGLFSDIPFNGERLIFLYKYLLILTLPSVIFFAIGFPQFNISRVSVLSGALFYIFVFLIIWTYLYNYLISTGAIMGHFRVSFPFSETYTQSDAHLYSSVLAISFLGYLFGLGKALNHGAFVRSAIMLFAIGALFLTGSRNGFAIILYGILIFSIIWLFQVGRIKKKTIINYAAIMGFGLVVILVFIDMYAGINTRAIERALSLNAFNDGSVLGRLLKFELALDEASKNGYIFGVGFWDNTRIIWYDGIISIILAHFGFLGLFFALVVFLLAYRKIKSFVSLRTSWGIGAVTIFMSYLLANLITEFALVTRSLLPAVLLIIVFTVLGQQTNMVSNFNTPRKLGNA